MKRIGREERGRNCPKHGSTERFYCVLKSSMENHILSSPPPPPPLPLPLPARGRKNKKYAILVRISLEGRRRVTQEGRRETGNEKDKGKGKKRHTKKGTQYKKSHKTKKSHKKTTKREKKGKGKIVRRREHNKKGTLFTTKRQRCKRKETECIQNTLFVKRGKTKIQEGKEKNYSCKKEGGSREAQRWREVSSRGGSLALPSGIVVSGPHLLPAPNMGVA
jgi:hypothetical protein